MWLRIRLKNVWNIVFFWVFGIFIMWKPFQLIMKQPLFVHRTTYPLGGLVVCCQVACLSSFRFANLVGLLVDQRLGQDPATRWWFAPCQEPVQHPCTVAGILLYGHLSDCVLPSASLWIVEVRFQINSCQKDEDGCPLVWMACSSTVMVSSRLSGWILLQCFVEVHRGQVTCAVYMLMDICIYIHTYICMNYCNMYLVDVLWIYSEININAYIYIYLADGFNTPRGWSGSKWTLCLPELHQNHVHCLMSGWLLTATFGRRWSSIIHSGFQKHASRWNANQVISRYVFVLFYL